MGLFPAHVAAGTTRRFHNAGDETVECLVTSTPTTRGDREDVA